MMDDDREVTDAVPIGPGPEGTTFWLGGGIYLADLPDGCRAMAWPERGGWLVGTDDALDAARAAICPCA